MTNPAAALAEALHNRFDLALCLDLDDGCTMQPDFWTANAKAILAALDGWTLVPADEIVRLRRIEEATRDECEWCRSMEVVYACAHCDRSDNEPETP